MWFSKNRPTRRFQPIPLQYRTNFLSFNIIIVSSLPGLYLRHGNKKSMKSILINGHVHGTFRPTRDTLIFDCLGYKLKIVVVVSAIGF